VWFPSSKGKDYDGRFGYDTHGGEFWVNVLYSRLDGNGYDGVMDYSFRMNKYSCSCLEFVPFAFTVTRLERRIG
jgi:hypothetical protein